MPTEEERVLHELRETPVSTYLLAHSKSNGHWVKDFVKSNLFVGLIIWMLSQSVLMIGTFMAFNQKVNTLAEWKGNVDSTFKRMDELGTTHGHFADERQDAEIKELTVKIERMEDDTKHLDVLEAEHRRITEDLEKLKNEKK